ncbi:MAG TPA: (2Fe-2S)-binding protein [Gammaproteobacteria bacterium]|nr:(2Fe-2S)-binding protein [Gammaproteobacteria bacterium]
MFKLLDDTGDLVVIQLDGADAKVPAGVSVAAALLYLDRIPTRHSVVNGAPRAPFCMMGVCFECLIEVDGVVDQRACQLQVRAGMRLRLQLSSRDSVP